MWRNGNDLRYVPKHTETRASLCAKTSVGQQLLLSQFSVFANGRQVAAQLDPVGGGTCKKKKKKREKKDEVEPPFVAAQKYF